MIACEDQQSHARIYRIVMLLRYGRKTGNLDAGRNLVVRFVWRAKNSYFGIAIVLHVAGKSQFLDSKQILDSNNGRERKRAWLQDPSN